jgi:thiamine-phosphate pyrophosphorylase
MNISSQFGFYAVLTAPVLGYEYLTKVLVDQQIAYVQIRIKDKPESEITKIAETMRKITEKSSTKFIVNDSPEIAMKVSADGVHLGQDDLALEDVRKQVSSNMLIGLSTHSPSQTVDACSRKPDYIGIGPVYLTPTKKNPDPVIGLDGMKRMLDVSTVPSVCIGGIDFTNLRNVLEQGAMNFCMVRQLTASKEPEKIIREMKQIYNEYYPGFY